MRRVIDMAVSVDCLLCDGEKQFSRCDMPGEVLWEDKMPHCFPGKQGKLKNEIKSIEDKITNLMDVDRTVLVSEQLLQLNGQQVYLYKQLVEMLDEDIKWWRNKCESKESD